MLEENCELDTTTELLKVEDVLIRDESDVTLDKNCEFDTTELLNVEYVLIRDESDVTLDINCELVEELGEVEVEVLGSTTIMYGKHYYK